VYSTLLARKRLLSPTETAEKKEKGRKKNWQKKSTGISLTRKYKCPQFVITEIQI
jgi:hypothetical protein